ncbi:MAG: phytoene desaturase family protein, partial [Acidobacteriota bacterium]
LVAALLGAAKQHGVELRTGARVRQIRVRDSSVVGVSLEDGERIDASLIVSSCDPKRTLDALLPQGATGHRLHRRILNYRTRGTTAQVLLALNAPLRFACDPDRPIAFARTTDTLDDLERAFDAVKYRQFSSHPVLDIHVPTVSSPDLAPAGHSVVSILVHFAPYDLEGGWNDEQRRILGERVRAILEEHAPGVSDAIVSGQVISPVDIEKRYGIAGGHIYHGEHGLDQLLVRPVPECARYRTPLAGLYLCGSGSHPGGGLTCAPGALAAMSILRG